MFYKFDVMPVGKGPSYLLTTDLNLDGELDLVTVNTKDNSLSLLYGKSDGTFHTARNITVAAEPTYGHLW